MTSLWIRVNARLADDADVRAFGRTLFPDLPGWIAVEAACGLLCTLWGRVIDEQEDGDLSQRDDDVIEEWAKWRGDAGAFASAFRAAFTRNGVIRTWAEYQGPLIARRKLDRERKRQRMGRDQRTDSPVEVASNDPHANPQEGHAELRTPVGTTSSRNGDGDGNGERTTNSPSPAREATAEFDAVGALLNAIPARQRLAWEAEINAAPQGMHGRPLTRQQVEQAARDFVGNGGLSGRPNLSHFRGYLKRAGLPPSVAPPRGTRASKQEVGRAAMAEWVREQEAAGRMTITPIPEDPNHG